MTLGQKQGNALPARPASSAPGAFQGCPALHPPSPGAGGGHHHLLFTAEEAAAQHNTARGLPRSPLGLPHMLLSSGVGGGAWE